MADDIWMIADQAKNNIDAVATLMGALPAAAVVAAVEGGTPKLANGFTEALERATVDFPRHLAELRGIVAAHHEALDYAIKHLSETDLAAMGDARALQALIGDSVGDTTSGDSASTSGM